MVFWEQTIKEQKDKLLSVFNKYNHKPIKEPDDNNVINDCKLSKNYSKTKAAKRVEVN